jgi:fimbrial chaperone protein
MNLNLLKKSFMGLLVLCAVVSSYADSTAVGGVSLGATRAIYPESAKQISLSIYNHGGKDRYLINSWVENQAEEKTKDFLITPPLFVAEPDSESTLRIVNLGSKLPQDRESVYWISVKAIPSIDKEVVEDKNILQLAVLSRIKLFVRPKGLSIKPETALEKTTFTKDANGVEVDNQSPYHISFVEVYIDDTKVENVMAPPLSKTKISNIGGKKISYQTVNDFGGLTPKTDKILN